MISPSTVTFQGLWMALGVTESIHPCPRHMRSRHGQATDTRSQLQPRMTLGATGSFHPCLHPRPGQAIDAQPRASREMMMMLHVMASSTVVLALCADIRSVLEQQPHDVTEIRRTVQSSIACIVRRVDAHGGTSEGDLCIHSLWAVFESLRTHICTVDE